MKAGSVGSNPNAATKIPGATQPLRNFLRDTGEAVAHLNTIVVGLDAVENGHQKPKSLNISWNPRDRHTATKKARRFAVEATLQKSSEALKEYINTISNFEKLGTIKSAWTSKSTSAEKISDISKYLLGERDFLNVGACMLIHWRNRIVHRRSTADLTPMQKNLLESNKERIKSEFSSTDITMLFDDFYKRQPTLKDVSTLITFSIRLVRKLDQELHDLTKSDLDQLLNKYKLIESIKKVERESSPLKLDDSIIRLLNTEAPGLVTAYRKHYCI